MASTTFTVGELVAGNYEILGIAGAGGMGVVYKARDRKLQRLVALKFLPQEVSSDHQGRDRCLKEARIASSLDHPNIGTIYGVEETSDGRLFIVMAFYDGQSLASRMAGGTMTPREVIGIAEQIARGLSEAHAKNVVHRDIKPSNVLLTKQGGLKIVDFGIARMTEQTATATLGTAGTIGYMSPEQALGRGVDQRTDLWSLGVVMAEALTGRNPFLRDTVPATIMAVMHDPPGSMLNVPLEAQRVIYRALAKDPLQRYQSCEEMLVDLEKARTVLQAEDGTASHRGTGSSAKLKDSIAAASKSAWQPVPQSWLPQRTRFAIAGLIALVLVGLLAMPQLRDKLRSYFYGDRERHVAVLPFDNIGNDPKNEALVQGIMDSLSGKLSNLDVDNKSLWVIPSSEIRRLKIADPGSALREVGATLVVKGSVARDGQDVRLNVSLIDTGNLRQLGSANLEDRAGDLSTIQDEAVARLARLMHINVTAEMLRNTGGSVNPAAYEDYLTALGYMQRYDKPGNLDLAIQSLNNSVVSDPRFALGFAQLGEAYRIKNKVDQNPKWLAEAQANCSKAVQLDSRIPAVHVTLARIHELTGHHDLALQEFQRALDINPRDPSALNGLAHAYEDSGRVADAEASFQKAAALRADSWDAYNELGNFYDRQGKYQKSVDQYRRALELTPDNAQVYLNLGATYLDWGEPKLMAEAEKAFRKSIELSPTYPAYANLGNLYLTQQRYAESAEMTEKAVALNEGDYQVWNNLSLAYGWLKQGSKADAVRKKMLPLVEQAVTLKPQDALAHATLAVLYAHQKLVDKVHGSVQTAIALAPGNGSVLANVAEAYELLGDRAQALTYMRKALKQGYAMDQIKIDPDLQALVADQRFSGHP